MCVRNSYRGDVGDNFGRGMISWEVFVGKVAESSPGEIWGLWQGSVREAVEGLGFAKVARFSASEISPGDLILAPNYTPPPVCRVCPCGGVEEYARTLWSLEYEIPPPWYADFCIAGGRDVLEGGQGGKGGSEGGGGGGLAGTPVLPGSPYGPHGRRANNFEAEILLAPKARKQNFGCQPRALQGEDGGGGGSSYGVQPF